MSNVVTLAVLQPGDEMVEPPRYDPVTREVVAVVRRADGTLTEERVVLPTNGGMMIRREPSVGIDLGRGAGISFNNLGTDPLTRAILESYAQYLQHLQSRGPAPCNQQRLRKPKP